MRCNHARLVCGAYPRGFRMQRSPHDVPRSTLGPWAHPSLPPHNGTGAADEQHPRRVRACVRACLRVLVHLQLRGHPDEQGIVPVARRVSHPFELAEVCMCARVRMHVSARARACACACACVCACMHARVRVCVRACVRVRVSRAPKLAFLSQHLTRRKQTDVPLCICRRGAGPHTRR